MRNSQLIIIGIGRLGTKIFRDVLCQIDGLETWPCDEINYMWRHGNITEPTDEFGKEHANFLINTVHTQSISKVCSKEQSQSSSRQKLCKFAEGFICK